MNNPRPLIALDFDGTLVSCKQKQIYALHSALKLNSITYTSFVKFWQLKRNGYSTMQALVKTGIGYEDSIKISRSWIHIVETEEACRNDFIFPGVIDSLTDLCSSADLMLLSARRNASILESQLLSMGIIDKFVTWETVLPTNGVSEAKALVLRYKGACCYVGDTESDFSASLLASIPFYAVSSGQRNRSFLQKKFDTSGNPIFSKFKHVTNKLIYEIKNKILR